MDTLGQTPDGGFIVKMTEREYKGLKTLALALEGKTLYEKNYIAREYLGFDFGGTFGVIRAFAEAQFRINEFRKLLEDFQAILKREESE